jgi:predicted deacylase
MLVVWRGPSTTDSQEISCSAVEVNTWVNKGDIVARVKDIFGNVVKDYLAEEDGVVIGRSSNPVAVAGSRIIHWGRRM